MLAAVIANLEFDPLMAPLGAAAIAAVLAAVVLAVHRWRPPPMTRGRRAVLLVLRLVVVAAVLALALRPAVRWQSARPVPGEVAVVIDASRSMGIRDAGEGAEAVTRAEAVRRAFAGAGNPYADLAARAVVRPYAFGSSLRPADRLSAEPADPRTDPAEALDLLARAAAREAPGSALPRLATVILVSDGRENRRQGEAAPAARRLAERGVAVHALGVGSPQATDRVRDVAVHDLRAPERVFADNRPEVRGAVATLGLKGRAIEAVLTVDGKEVDRRRLTLDENRTTQELVFTPVLERPGLARVALAVEPVDGELILTNNRAATGVRVEQGGIRVLYLDGRLHPENKYVARVLGGAKELLVDRRILVGGGAPGPADLDAFNVVILGDLPASALPAATVARLAERVRAGRLGLVTLGGLSAYGAGGWAATPLAGVLPVAIAPTDGQVPGPIRLRPTADGARHFILRGGGGPAAGAAAGGAGAAGGVDAGPMDFAALPPLAGASAVGAVPPTARLLAASEDGKPLLAVREFAASRVASLMVDTTWQWVLAPGETGGAETHRRFWRQLVLWVAGRDARPRAEVWVATDRSRYVVADPARPPVAEVTVHAPGGAAPRVRLTGPAAADVPLAERGGEWSGRVTLRDPGEYTLEAEAGTGAAAVRASATFVVEEQDFEMAEVLADDAGLRAIAEAGGGTFRPLGDLARLLADVAAGLQPQTEPVERRLPLAGGRVFLACVLAVLAAEWVLRRRWGMV